MKNILYYSVNYTKVNFASTSLMNNVVKTQQQERELWSKDRLSNRKSKLFFCRTDYLIVKVNYFFVELNHRQVNSGLSIYL